MSRPLNFLDCKLCLVNVSDLSHARLVQYVATVIFLISLCNVSKCICVVVTSYIHLTTSENTKHLATYLRMNSLEWPDSFIMQGYYHVQAHIYILVIRSCTKVIHLPVRACVIHTTDHGHLCRWWLICSFVYGYRLPYSNKAYTPHIMLTVRGTYVVVFA